MSGIFGFFSWPLTDLAPGREADLRDGLLADRTSASWERIARAGGRGAALAVIVTGDGRPYPSDSGDPAGGGTASPSPASGSSTGDEVWDLGTAAIATRGEISAAVIAGGPASPAIARLTAPSTGEDDRPLLPYPHVGVSWDGSRLDIRLDSLGAWPLYLRRLAGGIAIGTAALPLARLSPTTDLDPEGVVELISTGQLFGRRTLYRGVEALPAGAHYTVEESLTRRRRHQAEDAPAGRRPLAAAADELLTALDEIVSAAATPAETAGVLLSGGVDSRLVLALLVRHGHPVHAFTFGQPDCADVRYARQVTGVLEVPHRIVPWTPSGLERVLAHAVALTDGHVAATHFHGMDVLDELRRTATRQWNGFAGDAILGGSFAHPRYGIPGPSLPSRLFASLNRILHPGELSRVLDEGAATELKSHPRAAVEAALETTPQGPPPERARHFLLDQRVGRLAAAGLALDRHYMPVRTPFAEEPALAAMRRLRIGERRYGRALCHVLVRHFPRLAAIPWQRTGSRPGTAWPVAAAVRAGWRLWSRLGRGGGQALADYVSWMDGPLAPLRGELLRSPSLRDRSIFSASGLDTLAREPVGNERGAALAGVLMAIAIASEILDGDRKPVGELQEAPDEERRPELKK